MELSENDNSRQLFLSLSRDYDRGRGITFNRVSVDSEPHQNDPMATEEADEKSQTNEAAPVASEGENLSGVRKRLLNPAEEALESARQTAELILKDTLEALQRTKQRLMEILPHSLVSPSSNAQAAAAADKASKAVEETKQQILEKSKAASAVSITGDESDNQEKEKSAEDFTSKQSDRIITEPAMGLIHPLGSRPSASVETLGIFQSRL